MPDENEEQLSLEFKAGEEKSDGSTTEEPVSGRTLIWTCHPAKRNMKVTILVSAFIVMLIVIVYFMTYSIWWPILAFIILFGSLASFYFPTHYKFTEDEIEVKTKMQVHLKKWSQYRTYYPDKNGVLLSPFARPSRLENFRGMYIRFWYNKDEVMAFVKECLGKRNESGNEV